MSSTRTHSPKLHLSIALKALKLRTSIDSLREMPSKMGNFNFYQVTCDKFFTSISTFYHIVTDPFKFKFKNILNIIFKKYYVSFVTLPSTPTHTHRYMRGHTNQHWTVTSRCRVLIAIFSTFILELFWHLIVALLSQCSGRIYTLKSKNSLDFK